MNEPSGPQWCERFQGSAELSDLASDFQLKARAFIMALEAAGAKVTVSATYRPPERAYLMHWCCLVAGYRDKQQVFHQIGPGEVPPMDGVDIDWTCGGDPGAARSAAAAMRQGYDIVYPAVCVSRHTQRDAVDMTATWAGTIEVTDARGIAHACQKQEDLWAIGASFGVFKLSSDEPHWSSDGH